MRLSQFSVRRPIAILMFYAAVVVLGVVSYRQLPVQLLPDFTIPTIGVYMAKPGGSPSENLEDLTKPVEGIIAELPRVKEIRSWTGSWGTWIRADFETGTDIRFVTIDLQERLNSFQQGLDDRRTVIEVWPFSTDSFKNFLMEVSVQGATDPALLRDIARDKVEPQLSSISGVAQVEVGGVTTDAAEVELDPNRLAGYGLDFGRVFNRIQSAGSQDTYLGRLKVPSETHYVRLADPVKNTAELRKLTMDEQGVVRLEDIATITEGAALDEWVYRTNGNNAVGMSIEREEGENLIEVAEKVRGRVAEINASLPPGIEVRIETDIAEMVQDVINEVKKLSLFGALLALLVPLFFFRSWRIALIIFISVPICVIAVFNLFYFFGMSINVFSIIGLALGVGMLVDNSIVVVENCFRLYFGRHMPADVSAAEGGDEVSRALFASTLTSCVPFISLFFIDGEFKLFVKEPALALVFPLMISLAVALSLSATLTAKALQTVVRHKGAEGEADWRKAARRLNPEHSRVREFYRFLLKGCLRHRGRVLAAIALLLAFVWLEACDAVRESTVSQDGQQEVFRVYLELPPGTTTDDASRVVSYVEDRLAQHEDLKRFSVWFRQEQATFDLHLLKKGERPTGRTLPEIRARIIDFIGEVPGGQVLLTAPQRRGIDDSAMSLGDRGGVSLKALEMSTLTAYANRLIAAVEVLPDVTRAAIQSGNEQPLYEALVERERTKVFGVTSQELGQYIGLTRSSGQISSLILKDGEERTDVTITMADGETESIADVQGINVYTQQGSSVPFGALTRLRPNIVPGDLGRVDRQSSLTVEYFYAPGTDVGALTEQVRKIIAAIPNPGGVVAEFQGDQGRIEQRQADFLFTLFTGLLMIYFVMAAVFESYWVPFTIIATNPLMLIGIVIALAVTGLPFEELAGFGVILLNGLAVNNGIVLMDTAMRYRRELGYRRLRAVFQAADQRLRPILMTFLTTALGLLPLALFGGAESQWRPVAVTVVGGLTSATMLTLLVLPCFYMIGDDFVSWARPYWMWILATGFRWAEAIVNRATRTLIDVVCVWTWRPLRWPRVLWNNTKALVLLLFWRIPRGVLRTVRFVVVGCWHLLVSVLGDVRFFLRAATGRREALAAPAPIVHRPSPPIAEVPIAIQNLHVIYPDGGLARLKRLLPQGDIPVGHRPVSGFHALRGIELNIEHGVFGLLGPNGAGKTTLMRCIAGLLEPSRGTVRLYGVAQRDAGEALAPLIGYLPQTHGHYGWMTLRQYLDTFALLTARTQRLALAMPGQNPVLAERLAGLTALHDPRVRAATIGRIAEQVHLDGFLDERIGTFSGGMRQRAGIARVLLQAPPILIVDEPTAGLDPMERVSVRLLLAQIARERTVIFSTHIVEDLEGVCSAIGIMDHGELRFSGSPEALRAQWQGRVWEVPVGEEGDAPLRERLLGTDARLLYRSTRSGRAGWRCLATESPVPGAVPVTVSIEDAFLGLLSGGTG